MSKGKYFQGVGKFNTLFSGFKGAQTPGGRGEGGGAHYSLHSCMTNKLQHGGS